MRAELDDVSFAVVRRGYDRSQVEESVQRRNEQLAAAASARDSALEEVRALNRQLDVSRAETKSTASAMAEVRAELNRLRGHVAELSTIPNTVDGMSERLQQMVRIAQDEVNEMRSRATTNATHVLTLAQAEADELRERSLAERNEFEAERRTAEEALRNQLEESQARLAQLRNDSDGQKARLDAEMAQRRAQAEEEFAVEIDSRRSGLLEELASLEARQRAEAARIVEAASQDARSRVANASSEAQRLQVDARQDVSAAQRELEELRSLQHQVSEQLTSVRALLDWTLPQMGSSTMSPSAPPALVPAAPASPPVATTRPETADDPDDDDVSGPTAVQVSATAVQPARNGESNGSDRPTPAARPTLPGNAPGRVASAR
jgi:chromosome segregation ATPase